MVQQGRRSRTSGRSHDGVECFLVATHLADMRDIFEDVFKNQPLDPTEVARRSMPPQLRRRFYQRVEIEAADDAFRIALDGRPVRTPARHALAAPLGAVHSMTTLTGSALIALALAAGALSVDAAWAAAHVDEDWNMDFWGRDKPALERRAFRFAEMQAAATVLQAT